MEIYEPPALYVYTRSLTDIVDSEYTRFVVLLIVTLIHGIVHL